jgi:hypothetical protein
LPALGCQNAGIPQSRFQLMESSPLGLCFVLDVEGGQELNCYEVGCREIACANQKTTHFCHFVLAQKVSIEAFLSNALIK